VTQKAGVSFRRHTDEEHIDIEMRTSSAALHLLLALLIVTVFVDGRRSSKETDAIWEIEGRFIRMFL